MFSLVRAVFCYERESNLNFSTQLSELSNTKWCLVCHVGCTREPCEQEAEDVAPCITLELGPGPGPGYGYARVCPSAPLCTSSLCAALTSHSHPQNACLSLIPQTRQLLLPITEAPWSFLINPRTNGGQTLILFNSCRKLLFNLCDSSVCVCVSNHLSLNKAYEIK